MFLAFIIFFKDRTDAFYLRNNIMQHSEFVLKLTAVLFKGNFHIFVEVLCPSGRLSMFTDKKGFLSS